MATIYDFATRKPVDNRPVASFEILLWDDPIIRERAADPLQRFLIDGLVPLPLAMRMQELVEEYNATLPAPVAAFG